MRPEPFLNDKGKKYFIRLVKILESRGVTDESFSIELSILANEYSRYEEACILSKEINPKTKEPYGWIQWFDNGTSNVNGPESLRSKAMNEIKSLSPKFGLTPKDLAGLGGEKKEVKPEPKGIHAMIAQKGGKLKEG
jgi:phage terminase small subunit